jgi:two-component system OmpR family response regulator
MKVLLIEDDVALGDMLHRGLSEDGHDVQLLRDGKSGLDALATEGADVCILDVLLPLMDGFTVVERARQSGVRTPVLMLTARDELSDRVEGLRRGADDYLVKPFAFAELVARLEALTRRGTQRETKIACGDLILDLAEKRVTIAEREVLLSQKQLALLECFLRHRGQVVTRSMILSQVFGYDFDPGTNIVDVHVGHLRQRIDVDGRPSRITTVRGIGYRFEEH